ncbi:MAG: carboxymuconolactone decarboxylase family protein [Gammaproteobacteria bacterium]
MRLERPRIEPVEREDWTEEQQALMRPFVDAGADHNVFKTLLNHPDLMRRWLPFANHVLFKQALPRRERELVILRIGHLCRAGYEWAQHVIVARAAGLDDAGIESARQGPDTPGIPELDRLLLQATDELHADAFIGEATWSALAEHLDRRQLMDLVFTVGQYNLVSMALNSFGVQLDEGLADGQG